MNKYKNKKYILDVQNLNTRVLEKPTVQSIHFNDANSA